jgi:HPt (histidine-containing phosphotransfer) domain-containing protein
MREADAEDAVEAILATFVTDLPARLDALVSAVEARDAQRIQRAAHPFRSAAAAIGADALAALLVHQEAAARDGNVELAGQTLERVRQEADAVLAQLRAVGAPSPPCAS